MLGSTILDVVLGVVFVFLAVSLAASAITEAISSLLKLRHGTLKSGVGALLNDPKFTGLAGQLYAHALVNPLSSGTSLMVRPAYIASRNFAAALEDILQSPVPDKPLAEVVAGIPDAQLRQTLSSLLRTADGDVTAFKTALATWFDDAMERVGGIYKRRTQLISFLVALAVAGLLNADVLHASAALWSRTADVDALTAALSHGSPDVKEAIAALDKAHLIGWQDQTWQDPVIWNPKAWNWPLLLQVLLGWSIAAAAALFGAPFWFDMLQKLVWLRGSGQPPGETSPSARPQRSAPGG